MTPEVEDALKIIEERTGNTRLRKLVDPSSGDYRPGYESKILAMAGGSMHLDPPRPFPPLLDQAQNAAQAFWEHLMAGLPTVSQEVYQRRLEACYGCEYWDDESERCRSCGCFMKTKAWWAEQACPLDHPRWEAESTNKKKGEVEAPPPRKPCGSCG